MPDVGQQPLSTLVVGEPASGMLRQRRKHFLRREKVHGQFLTAPLVARFIVNFLATSTDRALGVDPACGNGVFLRALLEAGFEKVVGIDLDTEILGKLPPDLRTRTTTILGDGLGSLGSLEGAASCVVGNPPFSAKYGRVTDRETLCNFELARGRRTQAIEVLFLERFLQLVSPNGLIGIILPQGIFSALPMKYLRTYLANKAAILGVVSLPRGIFTNGTTSKTSILFASKAHTGARTFMGIAERLEDLPELLEAYLNHQELEQPPAFWRDLSADSFEPEFYWSAGGIEELVKPGLPVAHLGELLCEIRCGSTEYGERRRFAAEGIPFISAKTITPLGIDFARDGRRIEAGTSMDRRKAHASAGDVLFVRVGVGCSGRSAAVVGNCEPGIADDWIYIMRPKTISPSYLALFFYTKLGKMQVDRLKRGVGTVNVPLRLLKEVLVPIPTQSLQHQVNAGYAEMVRLRTSGHTSEAMKKFEEMTNAIEAAVMAGA